MTTRKIVLKKVKVGTPIKTVTAGSFGINNLGGVNTTGRISGSLLAFNQSTGNFEPVTLTGDSNHFLTFDSSSTPDTLQINFTNDSISGSLIPKLDSAFDLGSSTKKWRDLFLSGSTINLGDLTIKSTGGGIEVKDSDGNTLLQNIKYITVNGDTDILAYDSNTSTFTFNDSDIARTDEIETFHKAIKVTDSAEITSNLTVGGNLTVVGDLQYDDVSADSAVFSGSVAIGNNLTADSATITKIANTTLTGKNATFDSATIGNLAATNLVISSGDSAFFNKVAIGDLEVDSANIDRLTLDSGQVRQLSTGFINADSAFMDSATISTIATGTINADQQFTDSATITNLANSVLTAKVITNTTLTNATLTSDSATITNIASSQLTIDNATFDSSAHNTLHANALTVDSGDIRQLSVDFINADSAFFDSATITNLSTTQITFSQATLDSATINTLNADSSDIRQFSTEFINFDSAFGDSATITNIANTQLTGSQATLDSATITKLNVDSSDIDHLSTEAINFDSATGDSATITNIANSVLTAKAITGTSADIDSATIGNIAITNAVISSGDSATITNIANSVLTAKAITGTSANIDSATIGNIAATTINVDNINIGDSATFTNLATTQFTGSQATLDSATVTKINVDSADIDHFSTENINFDSATGDSATITNIASTSVNTDQLFTDSATITNIANDVLTAKAITNTSQVGDSATITNIASNSINTNALQVDDITIDGSTISDTGDLVIDAEGDITLDANGGDILFKDNGTLIGTVGGFSTNNVIIKSEVSDKDIIFKGNRGGTEITVLTLDMSDMGTAIFTAGGTFARRAEIVSDSDYQLKIANSSAIWFTRVQGDGTYAIHKNGVGNIFHATGSGVGVTGDAAVSGTLTVGNLNVDSADIIKISRDNLASGTGVTYDSSTGNISIGQPVATTDSVTFAGLTIGGNLVVSGTTTTVATTNTTMTDQLFELGNGRTGSPSGDAGIVIEMGDDSNAFIGFDQSLGKFIVSRTNATGSSTGNLVHTTAPLVAASVDIDSASIDSATVGNLATTQITGSQATLDSATITKLNVDSADIDHFSTENINFDSATGDSATITNLANSVLTAKAITGDSATIGNIAVSTALNTNSLIVDDITIDGSTISDAGALTLDVGGDIHLDAGGQVKLDLDGTGYGVIFPSSGNLGLHVVQQDKDFVISGNDGGSSITALTLDMSNNGRAVFNAGAGFFDHVNFSDNAQAVFGDGDDLQIYHDAANSYVRHVGTGNLNISGDEVRILNQANDELKALFTTDGSVELYFDNTKRLETKDSGVAITGTLSVDSATLTNLTVDSADIRQLSVDFINADSAFLDSATITTLAVGTLNIDNINIGDSATFTNVAVSTVLNTNQLIVDDITIDGSSIADAGDFSLDIEGDITFDANGGNVKLSDDGLLFTTISRDVSNTVIKVNQSDGDLVFKGNDGGSEITALTLDMSEAGKATFNSDIITSGTIRVGNLNVDSADIITIARSNISGRNGLAYNSSTGVFDLDSANAITTVKNALSTGSPDALTYDSAAGQFALNANHVMALIQTVDSNGSGLNADTLDGQAGSHYRINVYNASGSLLN